MPNMPNIAKVLKDEISRISRREANAVVAPIRSPSVRVRKDVAQLKRQLVLLERNNKELQARLAKIEAAQPVAPESKEGEAKGWISGKGIKSLRKRLGLSQEDFARLAGVSAQAVYMWESKPGMVKFRGDTKAKVFAVRGLGAREAKKQMAEIAKASK